MAAKRKGKTAAKPSGKSSHSGRALDKMKNAVTRGTTRQTAGEAAGPRRAGWLRRPGLCALLVFGCALAFRAAFLAEAARRPRFELVYMDPEYNLEWARGMATGLWKPPYDRLQEGPYFRAPLYSMFLALLLKAFGGSLWAVRWAQAVLGSLSCVLAGVLGRRVFGAREGLLAGLLCAGYWVLAYFDSQFLLPVLLVFLGLAGFVLLSLALERSSPGRAGAAGLAFGLFAVTRPNVLAFFPVLAAWSVWAGRSWPSARRLAFTGLLAAGFALPPLAATVRNRVAGGDWVVVASQGGVNFFIGNNPQSNGMQAVVPGTRATWWGGYDDTVAIAEAAAGRPLKPSEVSRYWYGRAWTFIRCEPLAWLKLTGRKALALAGDVEIPNNAPYEAQRKRYVVLSAVPLGFGLLLALFAVSLPRWISRGPAPPEGPPGRRDLRVLILLFLGVYAATIVAFFVTGRYRVPLVPYVALGAAAALVRGWEHLAARRWKPLAVLALTAAVLAGLLRADVFGIREETFGFARLSAAQDLLALGKPEAAIAELERLQAGGRLNAPEVAITLVQAHLARGGPGVTAAVRTVAEEALTRHPDTPELLWAAAVAHQQDRNWPKVRERVERLLQVDPENIQALHLAGLAALRQGRHHDAEALYQRAVQVDPYHPATQDMGRKLARPQ